MSRFICPTEEPAPRAFLATSMPENARTPTGQGPIAYLVAVGLAVATAGCTRAVPESTRTVVEVPPPVATGAEPGYAEPELDSPTVDPLLESLLIDDCDDGDNQIGVGHGRDGYWYTYADENGTDLTPVPGARGGIVAMTAPGRGETGYALRLAGRTASNGMVFAGAGLNFTDPVGPYDASTHAGVCFWAKSEQGNAPARVRVKIPDMNTTPEGGVCTECFNDFGTTIELADHWTEHRLQFDEMRQVDGWGQPRPERITAATLFSIRFEVTDVGAELDMWVDDVAFFD